jgi:dTDP-4-dehydrorhamnose reductase
MKIFVLGCTGMIGKYVTKYLNAIGVPRSNVDAVVIRKDLFKQQFQMLGVGKDDVVINLIGITNKQTKHPWEFIIVNSLFPRMVADYCENIGAHMIHISSDSVYSGAEGNYSESDTPDDINIYGISKAVGEPNNCTIIRTSVIGENKSNSLDLLEWVCKTKNGVIDGYTNYLWNGITCLQFAKICEIIINSGNYWRGVRHVYSPEPISKADLVEMIGEVYELNNIVRKKPSEIYCNRTLTTDKNTVFIIPPIREQLIEQKNFIW